MKTLLTFLKNNKKKSILFFLIFLFTFWQMILTPSHNRNWRDENAKISEIIFDKNSDEITVINFRDFYSSKNTDDFIVQNWTTETFDMNELESVDFILSHFHSLHGLAHSFLVFNFKDGKNLAISVETRLEKKVEYSPFSGLFNQYEIIYIVGSTRDLIDSRTGYRHEEVYLYKTVADKKVSRMIFESFAKEINNLNKAPQFYNTAFNNCMTSIVPHIEDATGEKIWWTWKFLLPGFADKKAFNLGFLANPKNLPFEKLQAESKL